MAPIKNRIFFIGAATLRKFPIGATPRRGVVKKEYIEIPSLETQSS
jgi:hypothetical protein